MIVMTMHNHQEHRPDSDPHACRPRGCRVVHCKNEPYDVYIGRPSKWGNPFTHKAATRASYILPTRDQAIQAYRQWITEGEGRSLLQDLHELQGKTLGCWCKPQCCHGDVLSELVDQLSIRHYNA